MKTLFSSRGLFILGFIILAATNIVVLYGVASNRSGEPESLVMLTERELDLSYHAYEENNGLALRLSWRALGKEDPNGYSNWGNPLWLNRQKLDELGFDIDDHIDPYGRARYYRAIPKEVYIVLELGGEPYKEALERAVRMFEREKGFIANDPEEKNANDRLEYAERTLERERKEATRLFAIDAGLDVGILRQKYSDRARYIITRGVVKPGYQYDSSKDEIFGYILRLSVERIHVPLEHQKIFASILDQYDSRRNNFGSLPYKVQLAYGQRLEPWIVSVESRDETSN
jgi:hypothetical protein